LNWFTYTIILDIAAILIFLWGVRMIWSQRYLPGWRTAILLLAGSTLWMIAIANEFSSASFEIQIWWVRLEWLCWTIVPTVLAVYSLLYNEWIKRLQWWQLLLIIIVPIFINTLFLTNDRHGLLYERIWFGLDNSLLEKAFVPVSWGYVLYSHFLFIFGFLTIIYKLIKSKRLSTWDAGILVIVVAVLWVVVWLNQFYDLRILPVINLSALALGITIPIIISVASRRQLGTINLYTLDTVFESLNTAVFLLGNNDRVLDLNRAGEQLVKNTVTQPREKYLREIVDIAAGELDLSSDSENSAQQISLNCNGVIRTFQVNISPIKNWLGQTTSKILVCSDITEHEKFLQETSALLDTSIAVSSSLKIQEVLLLMAETLLKLTHFNLCEIYEWDEEEDQLILLIEHGRSFWPDNLGEKYLVDDYPTSKKVLLTGESELINSTMDDPNAAILRDEGYASSLFMPIRDNDQVVGLMEISHAEVVDSDYAAIEAESQNLLSESDWLRLSDEFQGDKLVEQLERLAKKTQASDCSISRWNHVDNSIEFIASYTSATWTRYEGPKYDTDGWASALKSLGEGQVRIVRKDDPDISPVDQEDMHTSNSQVLVVIPISVKDRIIGVVKLYKIVDDGPIPEDTLLLWKNATDQAAIAFENARLFDQTQRALAAQLALREASNVIVSELRTDMILSKLAAQVCEVANATSVYICEFDELKTFSTVIAEYYSPRAAPEEKNSDIGQTYPNWDDDAVFLNLMENGQYDYSYIDDPEVSEDEISHMKEYGVKSILFIPILIKARLIGFIEVWESRKKREFTPEEIRLCEDISKSAAVALENARLFEHAQAEIDERMKAEQIIKASLHEKEILLKEIHHRVKNNLQIISSMLRLQSDQTDSQTISAFVNASQSRIHLMALIHEMLYKSENLAQVRFAEYVQSLVTHFKGMSYSFKKEVKIKIDVEAIHLDIDAAIPCGLILNELVSNSLEHAFPDDRHGIIQIRFSKDRDGYVLCVEDDGIGLAEDISLTNTDSLGLKLVSALVLQLGGEHSVERSGGTRISISFDGSA